MAKLLFLFLDFIQLGVDLQDLLLGKQSSGHHAHALDGEALAHVNQALVDFHALGHICHAAGGAALVFLHIGPHHLHDPQGQQLAPGGGQNIADGVVNAHIAGRGLDLKPVDDGALLLEHIVPVGLIRMAQVTLVRAVSGLGG